MGLAVVGSLDAPRSLRSVQEQEDFEQELADQFLLAAVGAGIGDGAVNENRSVIFEFARIRCGISARRRCMPAATGTGW